MFARSVEINDRAVTVFPRLSEDGWDYSYTFTDMLPGAGNMCLVFGFICLFEQRAKSTVWMKHSRRECVMRLSNIDEEMMYVCVCVCVFINILYTKDQVTFLLCPDMENMEHTATIYLFKYCM